MRDRFIRTDKYVFELEIEIASALEFSSGELAELLTRALLSCDAGGKLFPGVATPSSENRVVGLSIAATGFGPRRERRTNTR